MEHANGAKKQQFFLRLPISNQFFFSNRQRQKSLKSVSTDVITVSAFDINCIVKYYDHKWTCLDPLKTACM